MKGLWHSKRFRSNFYRWLGMYVCVMALLTTAITYSKYMTSMSIDDEHARTANFNFQLDVVRTDEFGNECTDTNECPTYRPTSDMKYYYKVSSNAIEVKSLLALKFKTDPDDTFKIKKVMKGTSTLCSTVSTCSNDNQDLVIIDPNTEYDGLYEVTVIYDQDKLKNDYKNENFTQISDKIVLEYSITQQ